MLIAAVVGSALVVVNPAAATATGTTTAGAATAGAIAPATAAGTGPAIPLGPAGTQQSEQIRQLTPGVQLTSIVRGAVDPETRWVVEVNIPGGAGSPDPDAPARAVQDKAAADAAVTTLAAAGLPARSDAVIQPATADVPRSVLGYRVRLVQTYADQTAAVTAAKQVSATGLSGRAWYSGWDGGSDAKGRWRINVLTIDPASFTGSLRAGYGPDLERREKVTELSAGATAAVNAGFFVLDPKAGAPGDPAGAGVYGGVVESEPVGNRPVLVLADDATGTAVLRPRWDATVTVRGRNLRLDGLNRVPGLIRNCGGLGDLPTSAPVHDATCTDPDELVKFTPAFDASTPAGPGTEVVVNSDGTVAQVRAIRGSALGAGQWSVQATGSRIAELGTVRVGQQLTSRTDLIGRFGKPLAGPGVSAVNGGPVLIDRGRVSITQRADGFVQPENPSFAYGWVLQRNPRTFAGVDAAGRTLLVTVDGRQLGDLGLSIPETAAVAKALGMVQAINLDGGGSTAMAVNGALVTSPSDAAGERPVGDAIVIG
ncbi:sporulation domain-containing protein [Nakamurella sp. DB0629]|uniref:Sporulation domain-containing protein n=2 Tax=Nakamurella aerolata TaxID=1656892 RepID=A0A849A217_9ACTN|nr:sporulation domain-containing protein [Nakamurella aerolata]